MSSTADLNVANRVTVGELAARFLEACGVKAVFGVISIHNMPILDAFHRRGRLRFVSSRGEAGACNMADAYARVTGGLGVCVTSTGTGCGNAAGAMGHLALGGTQEASGHFDLVTHDPDIYADNRKLMERGKIILPEPAIY